MAIITISRWSHSHGHEIAQGVAERLNYRLISRQVLLAASEEFRVLETKLAEALHDAPSILDRFTRSREKLIAYIRQSFLEAVLSDNVVYDGLAGHFFVEGVNHVLKVRILAELEERAVLEMGSHGLSRAEALNLLKKDDEERRRWAEMMFGIDTARAELYDMVIHLHKITREDAVDLICTTARLPVFETTPESQRELDHLLLAAKVRSSLVEEWPDARVSAHDGIVTVHVNASIAQEAKIIDEVSRLVDPLSGVENLQVNVHPILEV